MNPCTTLLIMMAISNQGEDEASKLGLRQIPVPRGEARPEWAGETDFAPFDFEVGDESILLNRGVEIEGELLDPGRRARVTAVEEERVQIEYSIPLRPYSKSGWVPKRTLIPFRRKGEPLPRVEIGAQRILLREAILLDGYTVIGIIPKGTIVEVRDVSTTVAATDTEQEPPHDWILVSAKLQGKRIRGWLVTRLTEERKQ